MKNLLNHNLTIEQNFYILLSLKSEKVCLTHFWLPLSSVTYYLNGPYEQSLLQQKIVVGHNLKKI